MGKWIHRCAFLAAIAACGFLVSCGKSSRSPAKKVGSDDAGGDIFALQDEVQKLLADAEKAGIPKMPAANFDRLKSQVAEGDEALDAGKEADARKKYAAVRKALKSLLADQEKLKAAMEKVAPLRKELEAAKKKAEQAKADANAKTEYETALATYKEAIAELDKAASVGELEKVRARLQQAKREWETAISVAEENAKYRKLAERHKSELDSWKAKAKEKKADEIVPDSWLAAVQSEADAADYLERGEFRTAAESYKQAARLFVEALKQVQQKQDFDKIQAQEEERLKTLQAEAEKPGTPIESGGVELEPTEPSEEKPQVEPDLPLKGAPEPAAPATAAIEIFENFDPSAYPQELDAEDAAFLELHYKSLVNSGLIEYDASSGAARLEYAVGDDFQKDAIILNPGTKIEYRSAMIPVDTRKMSRDEQRKQAPFVFAGNTIGFIALPVPFKYYVRVEYSMQIVTMDRNGTFTVVLMLDRAKRTRGYAAQWLSLGTLREGVPQVGGAPGKYGGPADLWFTKLRAVPMLVEFRMPDPKKGGDPTKSGRLTVTYDVGGPETVTNSASLRAYHSGLVGFQWSRTKFEVRDLVITGILDKQAAVEILRTKLGKTKDSSAARTKTPSGGVAKSPPAGKSPAASKQPAGGRSGEEAGGEETAKEPSKKPSPSPENVPGGDFDY